MFEWLKGMRDKSQRKSYAKYGDVLKKQLTTKEMRQEAIEGLADGGPAELVIPQLLKRFELVVDHGLQDTREKERVEEIIVSYKDEAQPFIKEALETQKRISWPIRIAERIFPREQYVDLLLANLKPDFVGFDETQQERNTELLLALKEISDVRVPDSVIPFVHLRDETVRMAALECLENHATHSEKAKQLLLRLSTEAPTDDNSRLLGLVKSILQRHNWAALDTPTA